MMIESCIKQCLQGLITTPQKNAYFDTAVKLETCAKRVTWTEEDSQTLNFISKRIEISHCLHDNYLTSGGRATSQRAAPELQVLALFLLLKDFVRLRSRGEKITAIKRLNASLKLKDYLQSEKISLGSDLLAFIETTADQFLLNFEHTAPAVHDPSIKELERPASQVIPLTVLFWEGPIARAYLATLKNMGLKPEKIIQLVSKNDLTNKKPVGRFLPRAIRMAYAESRQKNSIHHWSTTLQKTEGALHSCIRNTIERELSITGDTIVDALKLNSLADYSPKIEQLMVDSLADDVLRNYLMKLDDTQILFTGGGIVPQKLLEIGNLKFIHVHPGYLPDIRGADCALWSQLVKGRTSATCFYMTPGIDDGDVIIATYLPPLHFDFDTSTTDHKSLYRATYAFFDPWIRSSALRIAIEITGGFKHVNATPQIEKESVTYHFMHKRIQQAAFSRIFLATKTHEN